MNNFKYTLEPYTSARAYHTCPRCGQLKFTNYINVDTGEYLADDVGRCERINSCGYHRKPNDYFSTIKTNNKMDQLTEIPVKPVTAVINPKYLNRYPTIREVGPSLCALAIFLAKYFGLQKTLEILELYNVRVSKRYKTNGKYGAAFIYEAIDGTIRQLKEMGYNSDTGRRLKDGQPAQQIVKGGQYVDKPEGDKIFMAGKYLDPSVELIPKWCFFGEHLLMPSLNKIVYIVESEKSAIICNACHPDYIWLATGGQHGCKWTSYDVFKVLEGRQIVLFPDLNSEEDWNAKACILSEAGLNVSIYNLSEQFFVTDIDRAKSLDIADFMLQVWKQEHPGIGEILAETIIAPKANVPAIDSMFASLGPTATLPIPDTFVDINTVDMIYHGRKKPIKVAPEDTFESLCDDIE